MLQQIINYYKLKATLSIKKEELLKIVDEIDPHSIQQWKDYISYQWRGDMSVVPTSVNTISTFWCSEYYTSRR